MCTVCLYIRACGGHQFALGAKGGPHEGEVPGVLRLPRGPKLEA